MKLTKKSKKEIKQLVKLAHSPFEVVRSLFIVIYGYGNSNVKALTEQYLSTNTLQEEADFLTAVIKYSTKQLEKNNRGDL